MSRFKYILALSWVKGAFTLPHQDLNDSALNFLSSRALPVGTCDSATPCENGACCGSNNLCGYSPTECGTGCTSNCNAKAACGLYGTPGQQNCPLNVCCSQFGSVPSSKIGSLWLTTWLLDFAAALQIFVTAGVKLALEDAVLLLSHLAVALKSASVRSGQSLEDDE